MVCGGEMVFGVLGRLGEVAEMREDRGNMRFMDARVGPLGYL